MPALAARCAAEGSTLSETNLGFLRFFRIDAAASAAVSLSADDSRCVSRMCFGVGGGAKPPSWTSATWKSPAELSSFKTYAHGIDKRGFDSVPTTDKQKNKQTNKQTNKQEKKIAAMTNELDQGEPQCIGRAGHHYEAILS